MENINEVNECINELREKLYAKIEAVRDIKDEKVLDLSRELDRFITEYTKKTSVEGTYK